MPSYTRYPFVITSGAQTLAGAKSFTSLLAAQGGIYVGGSFVTDAIIYANSGVYGPGPGPLVLKAQMPTSATAVAATTDTTTAYTTAGAKLHSFRNNGVEKSYVDYLGNWSPPQKRAGGWHISAYGATSYTAVGLSAATQVGTAFSGSTDWPDRNLMHYQTAASLNAVAGITGPYNTTRMGWQPRLSFSFVQASGYNFNASRWYMALSDSDLSGFASLAATNGAKYIGLRYDTGIGDAVLKVVSSDGTTASETSTSITPTAGVLYTVSIDLFTTGTAVVTINGTSVSKSTNLPAAVTNLGLHATTTALAAAAKDLALTSFVLEQNL